MRRYATLQLGCDAVWAHDPRAACFVGPGKFYNRYNLDAEPPLSGGPGESVLAACDAATFAVSPRSSCATSVCISATRHGGSTGACFDDVHVCCSCTTKIAK